ncbi:hypothetical protein SS1G_04038 [Sclerotinia sclerotiorum 1980 UF-70]|uniref:SWR1-complex protein 3 domain-containing protein n=2 Tax=Sclerotinia sclerotiorum (strain ATCC 18683 / 1980 / Ss-1) TaxID=665079 RepID=A7EFE7_SCLS1|nr:hypothetical protein SS1G_04038 [Sclerotinia sclerotiorum 1980 UF-70]APA07229.1 hypothetical protein sscle_02g019990 [Sclerotinia sclerotiorum 1980 UF-70]EDO01563.1 hypothetical protein SS1G_04038 [Sclerotinia sclerotiorum 1980 UF-70]
MERKRKLPARSSRGEPASKKRTATPPDRSISATPQPPIEETLPKSIVAGMPLPTVNEPQSENLSSKEFQTISESGVLAESLQRSRQKWVSEGIFEKYWTKPTKKKGVPAEPLNNPGKDTMTKLGTCQITIEPHVFDATMYAIKEPKSAFQPAQQQQMYRPIIQYGPPNGVMPAPASTQAPSPVQQKPVQATQPAIQAVTPKNTAPTAPMVSTPLSTAQAPPMNSTLMNGQNPTQGPKNPNTNLPHPTNALPPAQPNKSTDPVIQMLAERAATDAGLKALMRIVANGEASPAELKKFQNHIDELNQLLKARQPAPQPSFNNNTQTPLPPTTQSAGLQNTPVAKPALPPTPAPAPGPPQQPQALRSKGPVAPPKPDISGVVFEFNGGNGDRYLFPKYSILDYLPGGQVIASFLIVRKGSSSDSGTYDPELDYYQPVTIRLYTHQGKQLDSLQKVVASPDEVRRYMDDIMDNMTRAEYVLLAMRLPRDSESEKEDTPTNSSGQLESDTNNNSNLPLWQTTNAPPPPPVAKLSSSKKLLTEEEKYQSFITSVT